MHANTAGASSAEEAIRFRSKSESEAESKSRFELESDSVPKCCNRRVAQTSVPVGAAGGWSQGKDNDQQRGKEAHDKKFSRKELQIMNPFPFSSLFCFCSLAFR